MLTAAHTHFSIKPSANTAGVDNHPRCNLDFISDDAADFPVFAEHINHGLWLPHVHSDFTRTRHQQPIEGAAPNLKTVPGPMMVLSKAFEAARTAPFNPNAAMARERQFS